MQLPPSFTARMQSLLGSEFPDFMDALESEPVVSIRFHPTKERDEFHGAVQVPWHPMGRILPERPSFTLDPAFHGGAYYVQEASSMFVYEALRQLVDLTQPLKILDLCAAPGGKSTLLLSAVTSDSLVVANEVIRNRVGALSQNIVKWGMPNVAISNHDSVDFAGLAGFFDVVLVDAPCSGEGLFRKDEAAVREWSEQNLALCSARQRRILQEANQLVKPGGFLLYSTCTFNPLENESVVEWLLSDGAFQFRPLQLNPTWGISETALGYRFYPHQTIGEGFFIACLQKIDGEEFVARRGESPFKAWRKLSAKEMEVLGGWIKDAEHFAFFEKPDHSLAALPGSLMPDFEILGKVLHRRAFGFTAGEFKKHHFIPSHDLALSIHAHPELPTANLDREAALHFLRKDNFELQPNIKGWHLASFNHVNLGWLKGVDSRMNNYLPHDWRIRMR